MLRVANLVRDILARSGISDDQKWEDLHTGLREAVLSEVADKLQELLGSSEYAHTLDDLRGILEDPPTRIRTFVTDLLTQCLSDRGLAPSGKLADALVAAFDDPNSVFKEYEWATMPRIGRTPKKRYFELLQQFRQFAFQWRGFNRSDFADPMSVPAVFAAATCASLDTPLKCLACKDTDPRHQQERDVQDWLDYIRARGQSAYPTLPDDWLDSVIVDQVLASDQRTATVRRVIEKIAARP